MERKIRQFMILALVVVCVIAVTLAVQLKWIANTFWAHEPAPWEPVTAHYYPTGVQNFDNVRRGPPFRTLNECREWAFAEAKRDGNPGFMQGDYECAIGYPWFSEGELIYRTKTE